jgi:hypothetical protein
MKGMFILLAAALVILSAGCGEGGTDDGASLPADDQSSAAQTANGEPLSQSTAPIIYYRFAEAGGGPFPDGSLTLLENELILVPEEINADSVQDTALRITMALQSMMDDTCNAWTGEDLFIAGVSFGDGHADVRLQGSICGPGDIVLVAARMQVLLTVFADTRVQTATVTIDGECIGNLGISHESEAEPADHIFTREDIEVF